jgi:hypothetical protein
MTARHHGWRALAAALCALCACALCALGAAEGSWHPVAARHRRRPAGEARLLRSTLGCGVAQALRWERRVCFAPLPAADAAAALAAAPALGYVNVTLRFTVEVLDITTTTNTNSSGGAGGAFAPACACGADALRLQLWSAAALVAPPAGLPTPLPGAAACGHYAATLLLPPPGARRASYSAQLRVVHVNGEGDAEPPTPRLHDNLVAFRDGPPVWNLAARVPGALTVPAAPHNADEAAGAQDDDNMMAPSAAAGDAFESASSAWWPSSERRDTRALCAPPGCPSTAPLPPRCAGGDAPGAWRVHTSIYPDHPGDPFRWRPFRCAYARVSGRALASCLAELPGEVHFMGESTLHQAAELMLTHVNVSGFAWPRGVHVPSPRAAFPHDKLLSDTYHGSAALMERALGHLSSLAMRFRHAAAGGTPAAGGTRPAAYVFLQGANDAARDTLEAGVVRATSFLQQLRDGIDNGTFLAPSGPIVWATAPVRQYTTGMGPGQAVCADGNATAAPAPGESRGRSACVMAYPSGAVLAPDGGVAWTVHNGDRAHTLFGTLPRRRAFNAAAVSVFRRLFPPPQGVIVDFEALTAALPSDYSYDGEHWVAVWDVWKHRHGRGVYEGRSMAGAELANVLANVLCANTSALVEPI